MDGDKLALVGGGLKEITGPVTMDPIPGIVANFVGKNALGDLANGIRAFEDLDSVNLHAVDCINKFTQRYECIARRWCT